ncbi:hypothetical protein Syun_008339 [Stephania yunnanensis]|uniref:Uncharacterized protein n=1 Tax=Stephania yunnanensis TaxID=152371 RepID=A0AAP0KF32_9MAGN
MTTIRPPLICASILLAFVLIAPVLFLSTSARLISTGGGAGGGDEGQMKGDCRGCRVKLA